LGGRASSAPEGGFSGGFRAWFKSLGARVTLFSIDGGVGPVVNDGRARLCRRSSPRLYAAKCYPGLNQAQNAMKSRRASPFDGAGPRPASPHTGSPAAARSRCARSRRPVLNGLALRQSSSTTCSRHITTTCRSLPGVIRAALENIPGSPPRPVRAFRARRRLLGSCRSLSRGASGVLLAILSASTPGSTPESFSRTIAGACILERAREWQRILLRK
jgi:hypothetical protein